MCKHFVWSGFHGNAVKQSHSGPTNDSDLRGRKDCYFMFNKIASAGYIMYIMYEDKLNKLCWRWCLVIPQSHIHLQDATPDVDEKVLNSSHCQSARRHNTCSRSMRRGYESQLKHNDVLVMDLWTAIKGCFTHPQRRNCRWCLGKFLLCSYCRAILNFQVCNETKRNAKRPIILHCSTMWLCVFSTEATWQYWAHCVMRMSHYSSWRGKR